jgi:hypothetical protein
MRRAVSYALLALGLSLTAARASAHAPLPRGLAVSPTGDAVALALPGFGLLLRPAHAQHFVYACDALNGIPSSDSPALMQYFSDGTLLLGSSGGLRILAADGCPHTDRDANLGAAPVFALAIQQSSQVAYAIAAAPGDGVWRSTDRGAHWEHRGTVEQPDAVNGLLVDPANPDTLYVSRFIVGTGASLLVSNDAGATFMTHAQERALTLLAIQTAPSQLWAVARSLDSKGNHGFDILRSDGSDSPWTAALQVNYFGGLTITPSGEIWVGDEGRGVYRSTDAGDSFTNVAPTHAVSCLASAGTSVWAATPDLPMNPALNLLDGTTGALQPEVAFTDVDNLVTCAPELRVDWRCQAAWIEWQRDVLMRDLTMDAGAPQPAAAMALDANTPQPTTASPNDAGPPAAANPDAGAAIQSQAPRSTNCAATSAPSNERCIPAAPWVLGIALALTLRRRSAKYR